ncbi:SHOCT domain-containing protein [Microbacterium sp. LWH3-1.2]|jgi:multidrug resistance efflux pump|uniref:SHOCT domain-containing protein n=1 Tax=Microbacterium sp. LWH3-1.2 TaxID=3135256 RepID=UPI00342C4C6A
MAARTAVVAGTATAVAGGVASHQAKKAEAEAETQAAEAQQERARVDASAAQAVAAQQGAAPMLATPSTGGEDLTAQLSRLGEMRTQGLISDQEFSAAKAKLLG